jgi:transposase
MNFKRIIANKNYVKEKYIIGIDPGNTSHKAVVLTSSGLPVGKAFGFNTTKPDYEKFEKKLVDLMPEINYKEMIIGIESSCNLWQTFTEYFKEKYSIVKVSPLTTYLSRGKMNNNFSKTDSKDAFLIAEATQQGKFTMLYNTEPVYQEMHELNIYFNKISNNRSQTKLRLYGLMRMIFPELLTCFKINSLTCLYLLKKYMTPEDFIKLNIEEEKDIIKKYLSHNTLKKRYSK